MNYYELVGWKNRSEGKVTKVSAERLNHMDNQILANANAIGNIEEIAGLADGTLCGTVKENKTDIETLTSNLTNVNQSLKSIGFSRVATSSEDIVVSENTQKRTVISLSDKTEEIAFCCVSKVSAYGGTDNFLTNCGIAVDSANKYRAYLDLTSNVAGRYQVSYILFIK